MTGYALGVKHKCPKCSQVFWEDTLKPLWLCLKCGRIYQSQKEADECECKKRMLREVKNTEIQQRNLD